MPPAVTAPLASASASSLPCASVASIAGHSKGKSPLRRTHVLDDEAGPVPTTGSKRKLPYNHMDMVRRLHPFLRSQTLESPHGQASTSSLSAIAPSAPHTADAGEFVIPANLFAMLS